MASYKIKKGFIYQKQGKELVIFDSEKSLLYKFNETGGFIFTNLKKGQTKVKIVKNLSIKYGITRKLAAKDFDGLIKKLILKNVILQTK